MYEKYKNETFEGNFINYVWLGNWINHFNKGNFKG